MIKSYYPCPPEYESPATEMKKKEKRIKRTFWQELLLAVRQPLMCLMAAMVAMLLCALIGSCTTPKIIEEHHHHTEAFDTAAVHTIINGHLTAWQQRTDSTVKQAVSKYSTEWFSHEDEKETVTETITSWVDSLGREMRQEQRTTERSLSRDQQQREERLMQEFETRLQTTLAQQDSQWQQKFDSLNAHRELADSSAYNQTPAQKDNRNLGEKFKDSLTLFFFGGIATIVLLLIFKKKE